MTQKHQIQPLNNSPDNLTQPDLKKLKFAPVFIAIFLITVIVSLFLVVKTPIITIFNNWNLEYIGPDVITYVERYGHFPPPQNWCDAIVEDVNDADFTGYSSFFENYSNSKENFPYTLNRYVYDTNSLPDDMIVLFTASTGWNQLGDLESVKTKYRLTVFQANGKIRTYRKYQLPYLKWKPDDSGQIPQPDNTPELIIFNSVLILLILIALVKLRHSLKIFWKLALILSIITAAAAYPPAVMAEGVFYQLNSHDIYFSRWLAPLWGFVIALAFTATLGHLYKKYNANIKMVGYAVVLGGITGFIASAVIHSNLMIAYRETSFMPLLTGSASFGIFAGMTLGWISSGLIRFYKNSPAVLKNPIIEKMETQNEQAKNF